MRRLSLSALGAVIGLLFFIPLLWESFFELRPTLLNYRDLFGGEIGRATLNSILVSAATVLVGLAVCASAAFGLAAFQYRGRGLAFGIVVLSFLVPFDAIAIPLSTMFRDWNLTNTFAGLILPGIGNGMAIFLLRYFVQSVSSSGLK